MKAIIDFILPPRCLACSELTLSKGEFCANCWGSLEFISKPYCFSCGCKLDILISDNLCCGKCFANNPSYDRARSLLKFNEHSKRIIHAFKYQDKTALAKTFAKLLCVRYSQDIEEIDLIIPVPMNRFKRLFRMYNPAFILAREIAKTIKKPIQPDILIKSRWTKSQTFLTKIEREKNLANSLKFNKKHSIKNKKILLIDDVLTTGSTVNKCSKLLKAAGANSVYVITIEL